MDGHRNPPQIIDQLDATLDTIERARARALTELGGAERFRQLAMLADAEARCWEVLSQHSRVRVRWRAALAAREHALQLARQCRRRATDPAVYTDGAELGLEPLAATAGGLR